MLDAILLLMTLGLGAMLSRVSLCAVAGIQQFVVNRESAGLKRLTLAACGSGVVLLLCSAWAPDMLHLPADPPFRRGVMAGGLLLGIGAMINGGCYLGSVLYLGRGNLNFLFTLLGIGLGLRSAAVLAPAAGGPGLRMAMGSQWLAGAIAFAVIIVVIMRSRRPREMWLALAAGVLAGLVYARQPGWSYGTALEALTRGRSGVSQWRTCLSALSMFAGALGGAALAGRFHVQWPALGRALRCLAGGAIMGFGAALVPGGNDSLLLWAIPGLTVYGFAAYGLMLGILAAAFMLAALLQRTRSGVTH